MEIGRETGNVKMDEMTAATAAPGGGSARDARRRRILERGTDRLAFITGQTRSVAPSSADTTPPPPPPPTPIPDQKPLPPIDPVTVSSDEPTILKTDIGSAAIKNASDTGNTVDSSTTGGKYSQSGVPLIRAMTERTVIPQTSATTERTVIPPISERPHRVDTTQNNIAPRTFHQVFTPNRITQCVAASENIRLLCALVIAVLVASSYRGINLFGPLSSSLIFLGPLYVVLLTDIAIVTGMLLISEVLGKDDEKTSGGREFDLAKALEVGLMVYRVSKALFMDCCLCAVIVIMALPYRPTV